VPIAYHSGFLASRERFEQTSDRAAAAAAAAFLALALPGGSLRTSTRTKLGA